MALKFNTKEKEEVPAEHLPLYAERESDWNLCRACSSNSNTGFSTKGLSALEIQAIGAAWQANAISRDTMTDLFRRGEVLPEGRTNEEEARLIGSGVPANKTHQPATWDVKMATIRRAPATRWLALRESRAELLRRRGLGVRVGMSEFLAPLSNLAVRGMAG